MSIIMINGVDLPAPNKISIKTSEIDNIDVNELGYEQRDNIRSGIFYISLGFKELNNSKLQLILGAVEGMVLNVQFPHSSGLITRQMRLNSDIAMDMAVGRDGKAYWDVSFDLKEY